MMRTTLSIAAVVLVPGVMFWFLSRPDVASPRSSSDVTLPGVGVGRGDGVPGRSLTEPNVRVLGEPSITRGRGSPSFFSSGPLSQPADETGRAGVSGFTRVPVEARPARTSLYAMREASK